MKFNYKSRGFVVLTLCAMLVVVGTVNYQLSKKSLLETSKEFKAYEQAQLDENKDKESETAVKEGEEPEVQVVDSNTSKIEEKVTETSKEITSQLTSEKNMKKATYVLDMKISREKQRNELVQGLNEMINNPSTAEETRKEASDMKLRLVKDQETELQIENILSTKGYENSIVYISEGNVNVVINSDKIDKTDAAKIFDLVAEQSGAKYENIKLTPNKN
ncbi:MAG: SpoIIIAH-like family protein [Romboutsia sp.]